MISWIYSENDDAMDSVSFPERLQITFDRSHRISEVSEQSL